MGSKDVWRNYSRVMIPSDQLLHYIDMADNYGDGHIFHHRYKNANGETCEHISQDNMIRGPKFIKIGTRWIEV